MAQSSGSAKADGKHYLTVVVIRGRDLAPKDFIGGVASSDPYCILRLTPGKGKAKRTRAIRRNLNPVWNHSMYFGSFTKEAQLRLTCWDKDLFSSDDFIGETTVKLGEFYATPGTHMRWYPLKQAAKGKQSKTPPGDIQLQFVVTLRKPSTSRDVLLPTNDLPSLAEVKKDTIFGGSLDVAMKRQHEAKPDLEVPYPIEEALACIRNHLHTEGIFRQSGSHSQIQELVERFNTGEFVSLKSHPIHNITGLLKLYFRSLPEPLLTYTLHDQIIEAADSLDDDDALWNLKSNLQKIPPLNWTVAYRFFELLHDAINFSADNMMTANNFAIVVGPSILWSRSPTIDPTTFVKIREAVGMMIEQFSFMFKYANLEENLKARPKLSRAEGKRKIFLEEGRRLFATYDEGGNGFLERDEFKNFYIDFFTCDENEEVSEQDIDDCLAALDKNGDSLISLDEFLTWWKTSGSKFHSLASRHNSSLSRT